MHCPKGMVVDHIFGDTFDCRKSKMRIVTLSGNNQNRHKLQRNNTSGLRGVCWDKTANRWRATVKINSKHVVNKYFKSKEEANEYVTFKRRELMPYSQEALVCSH